MASSKPVYSVYTAENHIGDRARKDAAIKLGESLGESFRVVTASGKVVHEELVEASEKASEAPAEEQVAPEPTEDEPVSEEASEAVEEDLIGDVPEPGTEKFSVDKMKAKIAKLLAKAERTDNEHERETFMAAAEKLMLRLGIDAAELEAAGEVKPEEIIEVRRHYKSVYAKTLVNFAHQVAQGWGHVTTLQSGRWADAHVYIIGHKSDVEMLVKLLDSLDLQVMSALLSWQKARKEERAGLSNYDKLVANRSFINGYGATVGNRIAQERRTEEETASTGAALVLAGKQERVNEWVQDTYKKLGKARGGNGRYSSLAAQDGRQAGHTADIGHKRVGGKKGELS